MGNVYNLYNSAHLKNKLSDEEQNKYLALAYQGNYEAQQKLFEHNLKLVTSIINQYFSNMDYNTKEELFQIGCIGLWEAITKYNPTFNTKLSTYAFSTILGEIKTHYRDNNLLSIPTTIQNLARKVKKIQSEYEKQGIILNESELAKLLNVPEEEVSLAICSTQQITSLNQPAYNDDDNISIENTIMDTGPTIEEIIEQTEFNETIYEIVDTLKESERIVLKSLFGIGCKRKTPKELMEMLEISTGQITKIKKKALFDLKKTILRNEHVKSEAEVSQRKIMERKKMMFKPKTPQMLFENFPKYSEKQILEAIDSLNKDNKKIIEMKYGMNGNSPLSCIEIEKQYNIHRASARFHSITKQIERRLKKENHKAETSEEIEIITFDEKTTLDLNKHKENIKTLISKLDNSLEQIVLLLRLGCLGNKYYTEHEIAKILNTNEKVVSDIIDKGLANLMNISSLTVSDIDLEKQQILNRKLKP